MTSSYKFHEGVGEIVPFYARYQYPTQANKAWKTSVKIPPRNGSTFLAEQYGASITLDLPAQGYLHTANSTLSFDVEFFAKEGEQDVGLRMQNNIQSIFERLRLVYGSLPLEDIRKSNLLVRMITEATNGNTNGMIDQNAILEGIGGTTVNCTQSAQEYYAVVPGPAPTGAAVSSDDISAFGDTAGQDDTPITPAADLGGVSVLPTHRLVNARVHAVQCMRTAEDTIGVTDKGAGARCVRRYTVQLPFGLFQQNKLIPLKWMASQLSIQMDLASPAECMVTDKVSDATPLGTYAITNMFFNAELLEYDSSYDAAFLEGLRGAGVPMKFASWNTYINAPSNGTSQTILIPERNRSLKALFTVQVPPVNQNFDSHAMVQSSNGYVKALGTYNTPKGTLGYVHDYQYRIGGKYHPAQPVQNGRDPNRSNGCAESYVEYAKALNVLGDFRLHSAINPTRWSPISLHLNNGSISMITDWIGAESKSRQFRHAGAWGPSAFVIACNLESSTGGEISGLNGEEQNDISLVINYSKPQDPSFTYYTFVYYDALLVLRENNLVELIK